MERDLDAGETELVGDLIDTGNRWEGDAVAERIAWLTDGTLVEVAARPAERAALFVDLRDGRYWERTYPRPDLPRGGAPRLCALAEAEARARYDLRRR
jgi:hypothetical protein